jgi:DMATS type aromatic prenyltransferase
MPSPSSVTPTPIWKSFMTDDFSPIEYSWKWNTGKELSTGKSLGPDIRYGIEAIGSYAGTALDPLNQASTKEFLLQLDLAIPNIDLTWFHHLARTLFGNEKFTGARESNEKADSAGLGSSSMFLAFEFLKSEFAVKAYFIPPKPAHANGAGKEVQDGLITAIRSLDTLSVGQKEKTQWAALDQTLSFMGSNEDGRKLSMFMIGIDCIKPSESRLKMYVRSPKTSFDSVVNILTMGGKRTGFEKNLRDLKELWRMVLGLPIGFSTSEDLPLREHATSGMCYYFDIRQGTAFPDIKMYIPVRHYGLSDLEIAHRLTEFLELHGRGMYAGGYIRALKELAPLHRLESSCSVQTYVSCAFQQEGLSMTSYLSPNIYHGF